MQVCAALMDLTASGVLLNDVAWSLRRTALGLVCGGALGLLLGTLTGRIAAFGWLFVPTFNGLRALPPVAIVPLVVVWAGLSESAKVFVTSRAAFFPVWLNRHARVSSVDKLIVWAARCLGARRGRLPFSGTFPAALPQILVGFRLAISSTLICVVVAEMTGAYAGLGTGSTRCTSSFGLTECWRAWSSCRAGNGATGCSTRSPLEPFPGSR